MRRGGRLAAAFLIPTFLVQSTGAADLAFLAPVRPPVVLSIPPNRNAFPMKPAAGPRVALPDQGLWGAWRDRIAPTVNAWAAWLDEPMDLPDPAAWLASFAKEEPRPMLVPPATPAPVLPELSALPAPGSLRAAQEAVPEPAPDRMLIDHHDFDIVGAGTDVREWRAELPVTHQAVAPRFAGPWRQEHGLRFRINYLKPEGYFTVRSGEVEVTEGSRTQRFQRNVPLAPDYWRTYALYHEGDLVDYEIELVNDTGRDLEGLLVFTNQEGFDYRGRIGSLLGRVQLSTLKSLAAGGRAVILGQARLSGFAAAGSNFEQTHLTVDTESAQAGRARLVDDPQAGIVDPPLPRSGT